MAGLDGSGEPAAIGARLVFVRGWVADKLARFVPVFGKIRSMKFTSPGFFRMSAARLLSGRYTSVFSIVAASHRSGGR
jgi:hypothetical protein